VNGIKSGTGKIDEKRRRFIRLNPSLKAQKPKPPITNEDRPLGDRRSAILELLISRTLWVSVEKGEECRCRALLEDNPTSG
jgi:hypothetical protein